jgi:hypothetical protein
VAVVVAPDSVSDIERKLFTVTPTSRAIFSHHTDPVVSAAVLPAHREVVAAWELSQVACLADADGRGYGKLLPLLAEATGPVGPAVTLAVMYGLAAKGAGDRIAAVDALLAFGTTLDHAMIGRDLGELGADGVIKVNRAAAALAEAARAGAVAAVWEISRAALPALLAVDKTRPGTVELVEVAHRCAQALGVRESIPAVDLVAARGGSGRLVAEARRLVATTALSA